MNTAISTQSKTVLTLCKIARIFLIIATAIVVLLLAAAIFVPDGQALLSMHLSDGSPITLANFYQSAGAFDRQDFIFEMCSLLAIQILSFVMLSQIRKLFLLIESSENPFTAAIVKTMKTLAILIGIVIELAVGGFCGIVIGFVIYAFSLIFQYAHTLQQQADETL